VPAQASVPAQALARLAPARSPDPATAIDPETEFATEIAEAEFQFQEIQVPGSSLARSVFAGAVAEFRQEIQELLSVSATFEHVIRAAVFLFGVFCSLPLQSVPLRRAASAISRRAAESIRRSRR